MVSKNQGLMFVLTFITGCLLTTVYLRNTTSYSAVAIGNGQSFDAILSADSYDRQEKSVDTTGFPTPPPTSPSSTASTATPIINYAVGEFHKDVPPHVVTAINRLYQQLKVNGSIINDLLSTSGPVIPNIYHYVRFNQSHMRFHEMLSIKSALKVGVAEKVYVHTNQPPEGRYWDMIKNENRLVVVHRDAPTSIFGKPFGWVQHASDLARIQILREYGGIYLDNDCIVVHEFERLRKHHCVVSKSSNERHMGNMLMMSTKDCVFMRMYEELYRLNYDRGRWYYNGGELPQYAILDQFPGIAYMADEGVQQGIMYWLWKLDKPVVEFQKYWNIIHLFYGHKGYIYNDTMEYDEQNVMTRRNSFGRIARWILYDHEELFPDGQ